MLDIKGDMNGVHKAIEELKLLMLEIFNTKK